MNLPGCAGMDYLSELVFMLAFNGEKTYLFLNGKRLSGCSDFSLLNK